MAYDKRKLAAKGQKGDTKIRPVDGKDAHVSSYEAWLIDNYGRVGQEITKMIGSGDINERTGLTQYEHDEDVVGGGTYNWLMPAGDSGFFSRKRSGKHQEEYLAGQAMDTGMASMTQSVEAYMGDEGFFGREQDLAIQSAGTAYDKQQLGISGGANTAGGEKREMRKKSNMATSTEIDNRYTDTINTLEGQSSLNLQSYGQAYDQSQITREKGEIDFLSGIRKEMNQLLLDYQTATGDAYRGESDEELKALMEDYT